MNCASALMNHWTGQPYKAVCRWRWFALNGTPYRVCVRCNKLEAVK